MENQININENYITKEGKYQSLSRLFNSFFLIILFLLCIVHFSWIKLLCIVVGYILVFFIQSMFFSENKEKELDIIDIISMDDLRYYSPQKKVEFQIMIYKARAISFSPNHFSFLSPLSMFSKTTDYQIIYRDLQRIKTFVDYKNIDLNNLRVEDFIGLDKKNSLLEDFNEKYLKSEKYSRVVNKDFKKITVEL